jgi:plasmid stabilization system protein ParE
MRPAHWHHRPLSGVHATICYQECEDYPAGSHLLYYQDADDDLVVVRILHSRQDPSGEDWSLNQGPAEGANEPM